MRLCWRNNFFLNDGDFSKKKFFFFFFTWIINNERSIRKEINSYEIRFENFIVINPPIS